MVRVLHHCHTRNNGSGLLQHFKPFASETVLENRKTGDVSARPSKARDKAITDRIGYKHKHNRDGARGLVRSG
jgi:hypothetical protein